MSEKLPSNNSSEEVDIGLLFNAVGNFFNKIFKFIAGIFKAIFSSIIHLIRIIIDNFKLILAVVIVAFLIGYGLEKIRKPVYYSEMLVKPYFDSKYQLVTNISYYNSLLDSEDYESLSNVFEVETDDLKTIKSFKIEKGPETENQLIQEYDEYIKSLDSIRAQEISFEDFLKNRDLFSSDIFSIKVESSKRDIFKKLSSGFKSTFDNEYSKRLMRVRDSTILIRKMSYIKDLNKIDSLQLVYLKILREESQRGSVTIGTEGFFPLTQEKTPTKEYDLFRNELSIRDSIRVLDQLKIEESVYYDVISNFSEVGVKVNKLSQRYSIVFPALALSLLLLIYIIVIIIKFVKNYDD